MAMTNTLEGLNSTVDELHEETRESTDGEKRLDSLTYWLDVITKNILENIVPYFENDEDYKIREHVRNLKSSCLLARNVIT